jgi:hypothetical protein
VPLTFSTAMLVEKNRLQSDHAFTWLLQVDITGAPGPLRYAMYDQPVVFHGQTFTPAGIQVDSQEDATHAALVNLRVTFQNVDQQIIALLETYWVTVASPVWTVRQWQIDPLMPDEMPFGNANVYSVQTTATDMVNAVAELVLEGITLSSVIPKHRYIATNGFAFLPRR